VEINWTEPHISIRINWLFKIAFLRVCLFIASQAIFQLSGSCHHYQWQYCKFRCPMHFSNGTSFFTVSSKRPASTYLSGIRTCKHKDHQIFAQLLQPLHHTGNSCVRVLKENCKACTTLWFIKWNSIYRLTEYCIFIPHATKLCGYNVFDPSVRPCVIICCCLDSVCICWSIYIWNYGKLSVIVNAWMGLIFRKNLSGGSLFWEGDLVKFFNMLSPI
jgi:hypothetical protein